MIKSNLKRVTYLDGVRGWASLAVLFSHVIICYLCYSIPFLQYSKTRLNYDIINGYYLDIGFGVLVRLFSDGSLAVYIFYVLSGYVLSVSISNSKSNNLCFLIFKRYLRLTIPILLTSLIAYIIQTNNLMYNFKVADNLIQPVSWMGIFYRHKYNIYEVFKFSTFDVFFKKDQHFNPILWTIKYELIGSFIIYLYWRYINKTEFIQYLILLILISITYYINTYITCFLIGIFLYKYDINNVNIKYNNIYILIFIFTCILSTYLRGGPLLNTLYASTIVFAVSKSNKLISLFDSSISQFLGSISFTLYLIQLPILCSLSSYLYITLPKIGINFMYASCINLFLTVSVCLLTSKIIIPIELFSIKCSKTIPNFFSKILNKFTTKYGL